MSMLRYLAKSKSPVVFCALLLMVGLASFIFGQNRPAPKALAGDTRQIVVVNLVRVQGGMGRKWQNLIRNEVVPALKNGGVTQYTVLRTATFGESEEFMLLRVIKDLAELDQPSPMLRALGQSATTELIDKLNRITASMRTIGITTRPDLSILPSGTEPNLVSMTRTSVAPGRSADFEKNAKEQLALIRKTNAKGALMARVSSGGDPNEYWQSLLLDSFADLGQLNAAYVKAASDAKFAPMPAGVVMHVERSTWRYVPELSIQPPAQETTK